MMPRNCNTKWRAGPSYIDVTVPEIKNALESSIAELNPHMIVPFESHQGDLLFGVIYFEV